MTRPAEFTAEILNKTPLSEYDLALLCDIGEHPAVNPAENLDAEQFCRLRHLTEAGLVCRTDEEARIYALTRKGQQLLSERGPN